MKRRKCVRFCFGGEFIRIRIVTSNVVGIVIEMIVTEFTPSPIKAQKNAWDICLYSHNRHPYSINFSDVPIKMEKDKQKLFLRGVGV